MALNDYDLRLDYDAFLRTKFATAHAVGFETQSLNTALYPFQRDIVRWALRRVRAAVFADCGLGKTPMQLAWAQAVSAHTQRPVLIVAPLAVSRQTIGEGRKFEVGVSPVNGDADLRGVCIINYERLHRIKDVSVLGGVVLDESSILKSHDGPTRNRLIEAFAGTPYRLACTATPSPNDHEEMGNHSEFLGVMRRSEMLSMFFINDQERGVDGKSERWRIKGHAVRPFWRWVCSWACVVRHPRDLGYADEGFDLPPLHVHERLIETTEPDRDGWLFPEAKRLSTIQRKRLRKETLFARVDTLAAEINASSEPWIIWCDLNAEADAAERSIPGAVQVSGSDTPEVKESRLTAFTEGRIRVLVTKPSIAGFGLNWQHCARVAFLGLGDSFEAYYQAVRRCWRFGQTRPVEVLVFARRDEAQSLDTIRGKEAKFLEQAKETVDMTADAVKGNLAGAIETRAGYREDVARGKTWTLHLGDCVEVVRAIETGSIDYTIYSPPFASLYTYSASERDMGNCQDHRTFARHYRYLVREILRATRPGRLMSVHCMTMPTSKVRDGVIGLTDFRGLLIRVCQRAGWIWHSEVCIWKDPVAQMQRTKALGLLHKQIRKDSCMSRQGLADYVLTFRASGANDAPVSNTDETFPVREWQQYASPVWMDINESDTLQRQSAREEQDEKHICPLQLEVIRRCLRLWSRAGDLVLSPFAGIGSEGYEAVKARRRFVGVELKESYWRQASKNLQAAEASLAQATIFDGEEKLEKDHPA